MRAVATQTDPRRHGFFPASFATLGDAGRTRFARALAAALRCPVETPLRDPHTQILQAVGNGLPARYAAVLENPAGGKDHFFLFDESAPDAPAVVAVAAPVGGPVGDDRAAADLDAFLAEVRAERAAELGTAHRPPAPAPAPLPAIALAIRTATTDDHADAAARADLDDFLGRFRAARDGD